MIVGQSAGQLIGQLQGEDLVIRPMPASGLLMPGANDAVVTPDGTVVTDANGRALYFITISGMVIGRASDIIRDAMAASSTQKVEQDKQQAAAADTKA